MKRLILSFAVALSSFALHALPYDVARDNAYFLTDKMAYELNLTQDQYNQVYQINLDYFLGVDTVADLYGSLWSYRNEDIRYVLFDWQYNLFAAVDYFFRPLRWATGRWYYPIFDRYRVGHYYFGRPSIYHSYHGGYGRRSHNGYSPYRHYRPIHGPGMRPGHPGPGHNGPGYNPGGGHRPGGPGYNHGGNRPGGGPGYNHGGNRPGGGSGFNNGGGNKPGGGSGFNHGGGNKPGGGSGFNNGGGNKPGSGSGFNNGGGNNPSGGGNRPSNGGQRGKSTSGHNSGGSRTFGR